MKKLFTGLLIVVVVIFVGVPFVNGILVKKIVSDSVSNVNSMYDEMGYDITIEILSYKRGLFESQMEWKLNLGSYSHFYPIDEILFSDVARHGYTSVITQTSLEKNEWFSTFIDKKLGGNNPISISTIYLIKGNIETTAKLAAFSFDHGSESIEVKPGQFNISMDRNFTHFDTRMDWAGCQVPGKMNARNFTINSNLEKISSYIWDGNMEIVVGEIKSEEKDAYINISNLRMDYIIDYKASDNNISMDIGYGADIFDTGRTKIENAMIRVGFNNVDAQGYEQFMTQYLQIIQGMMQAMEKAEDDPGTVRGVVQDQFAQLGMPMIGAYEKMLKKGLGFEISKLEASLAQGDIQGSFNLTLKKDMTIAQFLPVAMDPSVILNIFELKSDVKLPLELVGEQPKIMRPLFPGMKTGLFIRDGNILKHSAETKNSKLYLNDEEVLLN